jgi:hypothetical protein
LQVWYIDGKNTETSEAIEFRLTSPMDLQGLMIPTRQLHSLCSWCIRGKYRSGDGCDYAGTNYFDKNNNPVADPSLDQCNGTLTACKLRFGKITNFLLDSPARHSSGADMRQKTIDAIMAHAAAEYPRECCGVVAQKSRVERYFPCRNQLTNPLNILFCRRRISRPRTGER